MQAMRNNSDVSGGMRVFKSQRPRPAASLTGAIDIRYLFLILVVGLAGTVLLASLLIDRPDTNASVQRVSSSADGAYSTGTMQGVRFSIPKAYIHFPVQYEGQSPWDSRTGYGRPPAEGESEEITNFSLYVEWPGLDPHTPHNHESYQASQKSFEPDNWLLIGTTVRGTGPIPEIDEDGRNSLSRIVNRMIANPYNSLPENVRYEVMTESQLGLSVARLVGPGVENAKIWNRSLHWKGDRNGIVSTLVRCGDGILSTPGWVRDCSQEFRLDEIDSMVTVTYAKTLLPQWREIEARVKQLIRSFMVHDTENKQGS